MDIDALLLESLQMVAHILISGIKLLPNLTPAVESANESDAAMPLVKLLVVADSGGVRLEKLVA